jgi:two-component system, chemotaxis family, sensor kinase CheA
MKDEFAASFVEEAREMLFQLEGDLLDLEKDRKNREMVRNIFRVMHTLKGSAGMCGFKNVQDLTHEFEGLYDRIREGSMAVDDEIIDLTFEGKDAVASMLNYESQDEQWLVLRNSIREKMSLSAQEQESGSLNTPGSSSLWKKYIIFFNPDKEVFIRGLDPDKSIHELGYLGEIHLVRHEKKNTWEEQKSQKICQTSWEIYLHTSLQLNEIEEVFLFYDACEFKVFEYSSSDPSTDPEILAQLKKLHKKSIQPEKYLNDCFDRLSSAGNQECAGLSAKEDLASPENQSNDPVKTEAESTIQVSSQKLDELMNLVSELVTITASLEAYASEIKDSRLYNGIENIEKLTKKFRDNALDLRLVPVGVLLSKFKRQVRDLSKQLDKKVNFIIEGQDIEIDKTILKAIERPLLHVIRNSIDHGIEFSEERIRKSKSPEGLLKITAFYAGANVIIQVQDDGRGINLERVKECGIEKGFIHSSQQVTDQELINLIMEPGFTTTGNISLVSGRGVGMDVVKKEINSVGGNLEVFTEKDLGTSITLKLPTTLTIVDTLMIEVNNSRILIPMLDIEYCYEEKSKILLERNNRCIEFKNSPIPFISLRDEFNYAGYDSQDLMVIVINKFDRKYAVAADRVIGEYQAVIKPLGELFTKQPFFSGGSILVDGKLALILDTNFIFNQLTKS